MLSEGGKRSRGTSLKCRGNEPVGASISSGRLSSRPGLKFDGGASMDPSLMEGSSLEIESRGYFPEARKGSLSPRRDAPIARKVSRARANRCGRLEGALSVYGPAVCSWDEPRDAPAFSAALRRRSRAFCFELDRGVRPRLLANSTGAFTPTAQAERNKEVYVELMVH